jgi:agmatine deiminase
MPAEWEEHEATWLAWPHELTDWPGKFAPIPWAFAEIVRHLARVERVFLLVESRDAEARVRGILEKAGVALGAITFFYVPTDRGWMRDSGPIAVVEGVAPVAGAKIEERSLESISRARLTVDPGALSVSRAHTPREEKGARNSARDDDAQRCAVLDFGFNGWAKYDDYKKDAKVAGYVHRRLQPKPALILPEHKGRRVVLEGGAIDVNGLGTLLTSEECLLSEVQQRNPGFTRFDYAQIFKKYLGVTNVVWLKKGIAGDDTHGHVDDLARFVDATTVVTVVEDDPAELNYPELQENLALLRGAKDQAGEPLRVETLPMPRAVIFDGQRLPASYANFYIANKIVLVPTFNDPADRVALDKLAALFPSREIVPIYCRDLVLGLGTIHCMTQQYPRIG